MNQTLIIVPTVNERENLPRVAQKLLSLPVAVDLLVVDGNSSDGTGQVADELAAKHPEIHVLHEAKKNGLGRAYLAGFKWALERNYEFIFEMDCDFSHDPGEIPNFLKAAEKADLVLGSRYTGGVRVLNWPLKRLLLSRFAGIYVWLITGMPFTDPTGGYKCFRRRALQAVQLDVVKSNGYSFQIEMTHRLWRDGFKVEEVPIIFADRVEGTSKLSRRIVVEAFWMVWWLWLQNGLRRWPGKSKAFVPFFVAGFIVLIIFICFKVHENRQEKLHALPPAGQEQDQAANEYRDSLAAQILADCDTIKEMQSKMRAGAIDPTNGMMFVTNLLARDLKIEEMSAEFERTNR